jgi:hypothetical protein
MSPLPVACSHCRKPFDAPTDAIGRHRLVLLERRQALCATCIWLVEHPEAWRSPRLATVPQSA